MKHIGDITKVNGGLIEPVDVIIGGSPCQDLSVAGKRAGLQGERSGLFMEQIRIIKEMRARSYAEKSNNAFPRYMVWENVPGAFSSAGGQDFAAVLEETIKVVEAEAPPVRVPDKGWPTAGCYRDLGGRWSIAWRVLDAQFWGVPQRRRRIALVADFGGLTAPEILFIRAGLHRYPPQSGKTRESPAIDFGGSSQSPSKDDSVICMATQQGGAEITRDLCPTITAAAGMSGNNQPVACYPINDKATRYKGGGPTRNGDGAGNGLGVGADGDPAPTLTAGDKHAVCYAPTTSHIAQGQGDRLVFENHGQDSRYKGPLSVCPNLPAQLGTGGNNTPLVVEALTLRDNQAQRVYSEERIAPTAFHLTQDPISSQEVAPCLSAGNPVTGQASIGVVDLYCAGFKSGQGSAARGIGYRENIAPSLMGSSSGTNQVPAIVYPDVANTLTRRNDGSPQPDKGNGANIVCTYTQQRQGVFAEQDVGSTIKQRDWKGATDLVVQGESSNPMIAAVDCRNATENENVNGTLQAKSTGGQSLNLQNVVRTGCVVRRLTPLECERLQGYPDGWTDIGTWTDQKGKKREATDSARYKALGNSIALPPWTWVLKRLCSHYERPAFMGSLFDGIGGFPLIWERLNGKGSTVWASEIDDFPIAVTAFRFPPTERGGT